VTMIEFECHLEMISRSRQSYLRICLDAIGLSNVKFTEIVPCKFTLANQDDDEMIITCHSTAGLSGRGELSIDAAIVFKLDYSSCPSGPPWP
jgi:hypothetical protein